MKQDFETGQAQLRATIRKAREQGFLTHEELQEHLPEYLQLSLIHI